MTDLKDREKALEAHYHYELENKIAIKARTYKYLGLWTAQQLGLNQEDAYDYAMELVVYELDSSHKGTALDKVSKDLMSKGIKYDKYDLDDKLQEFKKLASREILGE